MWVLFAKQVLINKRSYYAWVTWGGGGEEGELVDALGNDYNIVITNLFTTWTGHSLQASVVFTLSGSAC